MIDPAIIVSLSSLGVAPGALLLDMGCGTGTPARALARAGFRVTGVDADVDAVETARAWIDEEEVGEDAARPAFLAARAEGLPFGDAVFDAVVCLDVFHWAAHEAAFRAAWDEAWRTLRPGGALAVRCLMREELPEAVPVPGTGRHRLSHGAEWFLPTRALLDDLLARGAGMWGEPPCSAGTPGSARFTVRKAR